MKVIFAAFDLDHLETELRESAGHGQNVDRAFRKVMQAIRMAVDIRDLAAIRALRLERLKGKRRHQWSLRLNDQWRLIIEFEGGGPDTVVSVIEIVDYH